MSDYDFPSVHHEDLRRARVEHECDGCFRRIQPGELYFDFNGCWDGRWRRYKNCASCRELAIEASDHDYPLYDVIGYAADCDLVSRWSPKL
jgi:hypothetical protein